MIKSGDIVECKVNRKTFKAEVLNVYSRFNFITAIFPDDDVSRYMVKVLVSGEILHLQRKQILRRVKSIITSIECPKCKHNQTYNIINDTVVCDSCYALIFIDNESGDISIL